MSRLGALLRAILASIKVYPGLFGRRRPVNVLVYDGYGTSDHFFIRGRVLADQGERGPSFLRSRTENLVDNVKALQSRERCGVAVRLTVGGRSYDQVTDSEGNFDFEGGSFHGELPLGAGGVEITVEALQADGDDSPRAQGQLHIVPSEDPIVVVSDIDDTVVRSDVTRIFRLIYGALFKNAAQMPAILGVATAFERAQKAGACLFCYVSGSPQNFHRKLESFLSLNGLPRGPIVLKDIGTDPLLNQVRYKTQRIGAIFERLPRARFLLVGDSGEHDPEVYRSLAAAYPGRVIGRVIRKVPSDASPVERFEGCEVVSDYLEDLDVLARPVRAARSEKGGR